ASLDVNGGNDAFAGGTGDAGEGARAPAEDLEETGAEVEQFKGKYGRYLDIDSDGIPYRTIPGTHATRGAFVTRGSSRDEYAVYTEDGDGYRRNVDRLARKWETAKELVPQPAFGSADTPVRVSAKHEQNVKGESNASDVDG